MKEVVEVIELIKKAKQMTKTYKDCDQKDCNKCETVYKPDESVAKEYIKEKDATFYQFKDQLTDKELTAFNKEYQSIMSQLDSLCMKYNEMVAQRLSINEAYQKEMKEAKEKYNLAIKEYQKYFTQAPAK